MNAILSHPVHELNIGMDVQGFFGRFPILISKHDHRSLVAVEASHYGLKRRWLKFNLQEVAPTFGASRIFLSIYSCNSTSQHARTHGEAKELGHFAALRTGLRGLCTS